MQESKAKPKKQGKSPSVKFNLVIFKRKLLPKTIQSERMSGK